MDSKLDRLIIAAPCPISWDSMRGDERVRLCGGCSRNVYNISDMSQAEAERFLEENGSSQCLRLFRRADGKVMTDNCPKGLRAIRNKFRLIVKVAAGFAASIFAFLPLGRTQSATAQDTKAQQPAKTQQPAKFELKGDVCIPDPRPNTASPPGTAATEQPPHAYSGKPMMITRPLAAGASSVSNQHKQILITGEGCPEKAQPAKQNKTKTQIAPAAPKDLRDSRAFQLYTTASAHEASGNLALAQSEYEAALKVAKAQTTSADPKFILMVTERLNSVRARSGCDFSR